MTGTRSAAALLTFSIGPVHAFIAQARRIADMWSGSEILSHLVATAIGELHKRGGTMIFPAAERGAIPRGLPNRFVCRVELAQAQKTATALRHAVLEEWSRLVNAAAERLKTVGIVPSEEIWNGREGPGRRGPAEDAIEVAWSLVPEGADFAASARMAAERFAASRLFRPFAQHGERGEKCAICGERTALPDGERGNVHGAWQEAEEEALARQLEPFFRLDQGRLCLVCATKRLYPLTRTDGAGTSPDHGAHFRAFDRFHEDEPYFAIVAMDGDNLGKLLLPSSTAVPPEELETYQGQVSRVLSGFAEALRSRASAEVNLVPLLPHLERDSIAGRAPQLVFAGGEDVIFVCDVRDALPVARSVRQRYVQAFGALAAKYPTLRFTISAGILFAHSKQPAGLLFRDAERLLTGVAKEAEGRDAVAVRLAKRGGPPVEVSFQWDAAAPNGTWIELLNRLTHQLSTRALGSRQSFNLAEEERVLTAAFGGDVATWEQWFTEQLSRGEGPQERPAELAGLLTPFFVGRKTQALRIARFLGVEIES